MAEIINLRRARKAKQRQDDAKTADFNRAKFGRSKADKQLAAAETALTVKTLDGHKRSDDT
jgi:Domain of unknown function (DUF4169)